MRHGLIAACSLAVVVCACNTSPPHQNPFDPNTPATGQAKATLSGKVVLEGGGRATSPAGAHVVVSGTGLSADADANGAWSISGVSPGVYSITASLAGYENAIVPGVVITLRDGEATVTVDDAVLKIARGSVLGKILLEGEPSHAGTVVSLTGVQGSVQTGADGAYSLPGVAAGSYTLTAVKNGFADGSISSVLVEGGKATTATTITLTARPGSIAGNVVITGLTNFSGVKIDADGLTLGGNHHTAQAFTNQDGDFTLSAIPAGNYSITYTYAGFVGQSTSATVSPDAQSSLPGIRLAPETGGIKGTALLAGSASAAGIDITLTPHANPAALIAAATSTTASGEWSIDNLPVGDYDVAYAHTGYVGVTRTETIAARNTTTASAQTLAAIPTIVRGVVTRENASDHTGITVQVEGTTVSTAALASGAFTVTGAGTGTQALIFSFSGYDTQRVPITLAPGDVIDLFPVRLLLSRGGVSGAVQLAPAIAGSGATVTLSAGASTFTAAADATGAFSFTGIPTGGYSLQASKPPDWLDSVAASVTVTAGATSAAGTITLQPAQTADVSGSVTLEGAGSAAGILVQLSGTDFRGQTVSSSVTTASAGLYDFASLAAGTYQLSFSRAGWDAVSSSITVATASVNPQPALRLNLSRGDITGTVTLDQMTDHSGIIATVAGTSITTVTDATGAFTLARVPVGTGYQVTLARAPDWAGDGYANVQVTAGNVTALTPAKTLFPSATASISGAVTLEGGATPSGVTVSIGGTDFRGKSVTAGSVVTGATGAYTFNNLPGGTYTVSFSKSNFDGASTAAAVSSGGSATAASTQLAISRGGVSATILLAPSIAGSGATATLSAGTSTYTAAADATGAVAFTQIPVGSYTLKASKPPDWVDSAPAGITVASGSSASGGTITLQPVKTSDVTGAVTLEGAANAAGVQVQLAGTDFRGQPVSLSFTTLAAGSYAFTALAAGSYQLTISKSAFDTATSSITVGTASSNPQPSVRLNLSRGSIAGSVTLDQMADSSGIVVGVQGTPITTVTDATGAFTLAGVPVGTGYTITLARAPDWASDSYTGVAVTSGATTALSPARTLFPRHASTIAGFVSLEGGASPAGVTVSITGTDFRGQAVTGVANQTTLAAGTYSFGSLPAGTYSISLSKGGYDAGSASAAVSSGSTASAGGTQLAISRGGADGVASLSGVATGAWAGTTVRLFGNGGLSFVATTDSTGAYSFTRIPVGDYTLTASRPPDWTDSAGTAVTIASGASTPVTSFALSPKATASIAGSVALEGGGTPSATVTLTGTDFRGVVLTAQSLTNVSGSYSFTSLAAGSYTITVSNALYDNGATGAAVVTGSTNTAALVTLARSRGTVVGKYLLDQVTDATGIVVSVQGTTFTAVTDSTGVFTLANLPTSASGYTLNAVKDANWQTISTAAVQVLAGQTTDLRGAAPATITLLANKTSQLSGNATHEDGASPVGITVALSGTDFRGVAVTASTNPNGSGVVGFTGLAAGNYRITVSDSGYDTASVTISIGPSALVSAGSVSLAVSRGSLSGNVTASPGSVAQSGTNVFLANGTGLITSATTDASGNYTFSAIRAASGYAVAAQRPGYTTDVATGVSVTAHQNSAVPQLSIAPDTTGKIVGNVLKTATDGLSGVTVDLTGTDLNGQAVSTANAATTDTDGNFQITALAQGTYAVTYRKDRYQSRTVSGIFLAAGHTAAVPAQLPMALSLAVVSGTVTLSGAGAGAGGSFNVGTDYSGIQVGLNINGNPFGQAVTDSSGAFRFTDVPENVDTTTYSLKASKPNFVDGSSQFTDLGADKSVTMSALVLQFARASGTVILDDNIDGNGPNLSWSGALVSLSGTAYNNVTYSDSTFSQPAGGLVSEGFWGLNGIPPGSYTLTVVSTNRNCGAGEPIALPHGFTATSINFLCEDSLPPGALTWGTTPEVTKETGGPVSLQTQSTDLTLNFRGYQVTVTPGSTPDWNQYVLIEGQHTELILPCGDPNLPPQPGCKPLKPGRNTLWARGVDWKGNAGPASSFEVFYDPDRPNMPGIHLARPFPDTLPPSRPPTSYINDTTTSVTLAGSEGDATFRSYQVCSVIMPMTGSCPAVTAGDPNDTIAMAGPPPVQTYCTASNSFADQPSTFAQSLQGPLTCLYVRAADSAGNVSHVAAAQIYSDVQGPVAPSIAPVFDPSSLTVRTTSVDVFLSKPARDPPGLALDENNDPLPWLGIDYLEIDSGSGFIPLCPQACKGQTTFDPCNCGCSDPRLRCTNGSLTALRLPVRPGTNTITVRAVDLAGNTGDGVSTQVPVATTAPLVTDRAGGSAPIISGSAILYEAGGGTINLLDLGSNRVRETGEDPFQLGFTDQNRTGAALGPAGALISTADGDLCDNDTSPSRRLLLRTRNTITGVFESAAQPAEVACTQQIEPGLSYEDVGVGSNTIAWTEFDSGVGKRQLHVRVPSAGFDLGDKLVPHSDFVLSLGPQGETPFVCPVQGFQYARRHALFATMDPPAGSALDQPPSACTTAVDSLHLNRTWVILNAPPDKANLTAISPTLSTSFTAAAAALSQDGTRLAWVVDGGQGPGLPNLPVTLHVCSTDAQLALNPSGGNCVTRLFPLPPGGYFQWSVAVEGNHAVFIGNSFGGQLSYITDWNSGLDGKFDSGAQADDTVTLLAPTTVYRNSPSISSGLMVYAYNTNGEHDSLLTLDLTQMSWDQVSGTDDLMYPQIDNTPIPDGVPEAAPALLSVTSAGQKLRARTLSNPATETTLTTHGAGASFAGKGFDVTGADMVIVGRDNSVNGSQGIFTTNMGPDGLWFTADDIGPTTIFTIGNNQAQSPTPVAGGGNALVFVETTVDGNGEDHPYLIQPQPLPPPNEQVKTLAAPGNTGIDLAPGGTFGVPVHVPFPTGGVGKEHAVWVGLPNPGRTNSPNVWVREFVGAPATASPPPAGDCGSGERVASRLWLGALGLQGTPHAATVRLTKVGNHNRVILTTLDFGGSILVIDDGGDGHFDTEACHPAGPEIDGTGASNDVILTVIPLYGARPNAADFVVNGDDIAFIAVSPDLGQQLYVANAITGVVTQQTNFFSPKVNLSIDATGRAYWSDSVFGVRALFRFQP